MSHAINNPVRVMRPCRVDAKSLDLALERYCSHISGAAYEFGGKPYIAFVGLDAQPQLEFPVALGRQHTALCPDRNDSWQFFVDADFFDTPAVQELYSFLDPIGCGCLQVPIGVMVQEMLANKGKQLRKSEERERFTMSSSDSEEREDRDFYNEVSVPLDPTCFSDDDTPDFVDDYPRLKAMWRRCFRGVEWIKRKLKAAGVQLSGAVSTVIETFSKVLNTIADSFSTLGEKIMNAFISHAGTLGANVFIIFLAVCAGTGVCYLLFKLVKIFANWAEIFFPSLDKKIVHAVQEICGLDPSLLKSEDDVVVQEALQANMFPRIATLSMILAAACPDLAKGNAAAVVRHAATQAQLLGFAAIGLEGFAKVMPEFVVNFLEKHALIESRVSHDKQFMGVLDRAAQLRANFKDPKFFLNKMNLDAFERTYTELETQSAKKMPFLQPDSHIAQLVASLRMEFAATKQTVTAVNSMAIRVKPQGVYLEGGAGVGKSHTMKLIIYALLYPDETYASAVYMRSNTKHMDAFAGQRIFFKDDFYTIKEKNTEEAAEIIGLINEVPMILPQAKADMKGMTFRGDYIMITSNYPFTSDMGCTAADAFTRRCVAWRTEVKQGFKNPGKEGSAEAIALIERAVQASIAAGEYNPAPHLVFYPYVDDPRARAGKRLDNTQPMSFPEVVLAIRRARALELELYQRRDAVLDATKLYYNKIAVQEMDPAKPKPGIQQLDPKEIPVTRPWRKGEKQVVPDLWYSRSSADCSSDEFESTQSQDSAGASGQEPPIPAPKLDWHFKIYSKSQVPPDHEKLFQDYYSLWVQCAASVAPGKPRKKVFDYYVSCLWKCGKEWYDAQLYRGIFKQWSPKQVARLFQERRLDANFLLEVQNWRWMKPKVPVDDGGGSSSSSSSSVPCAKQESASQVVDSRALAASLVQEEQKRRALAEVSEAISKAYQTTKPISVDSKQDDIKGETFPLSSRGEPTLTERLPVHDDSFKAVRESITAMMTTVNLTHIVLGVTAVAGILAAVTFLAKYVSMKSQSQANEMEGEDVVDFEDSGKKHRRKNGKRAGKRARKRADDPYYDGYVDLIYSGRQEAGSALRDIQMEEARRIKLEAAGQMRKLLDNCVQVSLTSGEKLYGWVLEGRTLLLNKHFFYVGSRLRLDPGTRVSVRYQKSIHIFDFEVERLRPIGEADLAIYQLPNTFPMMRSTVNYLMEDLDPTIAHDSLSAEYVAGSEDDLRAFRLFRLLHKKRMLLSRPANSPETIKVDDQVWQYEGEIETEPGFCGGLIVLVRKNGKVVVVGMHAGSVQRFSLSNLGVAVPLDRTKLGIKESVANQQCFVPDDPCFPDYKDLMAEIKLNELDPAFNQLGCLPKAKPYISKSHIVPSIFARRGDPIVDGVTHEPAFLGVPARLRSEEDESCFDVLVRTVNTMVPGPKTAKFKGGTREEHKAVVAHMVRRHRMRAKLCKPFVLSEDEAINGVECPFGSIKRLSMKNSAGYPLADMLKAGEKGRRPFFFERPDGTLEVANAELRSQLDAYYSGDEPNVVYVCVLKDETRSQAKIKTPRLITAAPLAATIVARQQLAAWMMADTFGHPDVMSCVGMNPYSDQWAEMVRNRMMKFNDGMGFAGDIKYFDSNMNDDILDCLLQCTDAYYGDVGDRNLRHHLLRSTMYSTLKIGKFFVTKDFGGTTGNFCTVHINNLMCEYLLTLCYHRLAKQNHPEISDPVMMDRFVSAAVYGDDHWCNVHRTIADWFTFHTVRDEMASLGVVYTDSEKRTEGIPGLQSLLTLPFLGLVTRYDPTFYLGVEYLPVVKEPSFKTLKWVSGDLPAEDAIRLSAVSLCHRNVGLSQDDYSSFLRRLEDAFARIDCEARLPTYLDSCRVFHGKLIDWTDDSQWMAHSEMPEEVEMRFVLDLPVSKFGSPIPKPPAQEDVEIVYDFKDEEVRDSDWIAVQEMQSEEKEISKMDEGREIAPPAPAQERNNFSMVTVEDICKRRVLTMTLASNSPAAFPFSSIVLGPTSGRSIAGLTTWFLRMFRWWFGPWDLLLFGTAGIIKVATTGNPDPASSIAEALLASASYFPGACAQEVGDVADTPMVVRCPGEHMTPDNWNIVPQSASELSGPFVGGCFVIFPPASGTVSIQIYASVGDGFTACQLYRIPNYTVYAAKDEEKHSYPTLPSTLCVADQEAGPELVLSPAEELEVEDDIWSLFDDGEDLKQNVEDVSAYDFQCAVCERAKRLERYKQEALLVPESEPDSCWRMPSEIGNKISKFDAAVAQFEATLERTSADAIQEGGVGSKVSKGIGSAVQTYGNIRKMTDQAVDVATKVGDAVRNFDTPLVAQHPQPTLAIYCPPVSAMSGIRYGTVLGPLVNEPPKLNSPRATRVNETSLLRMCMTPTLLNSSGRNRLTTMSAPGDQVFVIPITPAPELFMASGSTQIYPTILEYVSTPFLKWRGTLEYTIQFVGPQVANARVAFCTRYGRFGESVSVANLSSQFSLIYNYGASDTIKISVPYHSNHEWCRVPTGSTGYYDELDTYAIGELICVVLSTYAANETVNSGIDVNVYLSAGSDFELMTPCGNIAWLKMPTDVVRQQMLRTGGQGGDALSDEMKKIEVRPNGGPQATPLVNDGPLAMFGRRYVLTTADWATTDDIATVLYYADVPFGLIPVGPLQSVFNAFLYKKFRTRVFIEIQSNAFQQGQLACFYVPAGVDHTSVSDQEVTINQHVLLKAGLATTGEVEIPFVHPYNALDASYLGDSLRGSLGTFAVRVFNKLYVGAGAPAESKDVTFVISVQFEDMELSVPDPDEDPPRFQSAKWRAGRPEKSDSGDGYSKPS